PSASLIDNVFRVSGLERHRGLELNMYGEPLPGFRLLGGAAYIDAKMTRNPDPTLEGKHPIGVPKWQSSLNAELDIPGTHGLTVDGRVVYSGKQYINALNTFSIPSYAVFDLGARYKINVGDQSLTVRARL